MVLYGVPTIAMGFGDAFPPPGTQVKLEDVPAFVAVGTVPWRRRAGIERRKMGKQSEWG